jgi:hypothetical protein
VSTATVSIAGTKAAESIATAVESAQAASLHSVFDPQEVRTIAAEIAKIAITFFMFLWLFICFIYTLALT